MRIDKVIADRYFEIIERLNLQKDEFFYNEGSSFARDTFRSIKSLRKTSKHYVKTVQPTHEDFKRAVRTAIRVVDTTLASKHLYEVNIESLNEIKEQLESLHVMIELAQ